MNNASIKEVFNELVTQVQYLIDGQISLNDLVHTKQINSLGTVYKDDNFYMNVFIKKLTNQGISPQVGDKLSYLVVDRESATILGEKMILLEHYLTQNNHPEPLDYLHYIDRLSPINKLFKDNFADIPNDIWFQKNSHHKKIYLNDPIKLIRQYYETHGTLDGLKSN